jgi:hypothetical protein
MSYRIQIQRPLDQGIDKEKVGPVFSSVEDAWNNIAPYESIAREEEVFFGLRWVYVTVVEEKSGRESFPLKKNPIKENPLPHMEPLSF